MKNRKEPAIKNPLYILKNSIKSIFFAILFIVFIYSFNYIFQLYILKNSFPTFFGLTHVKVEGESMLPTINPNSYLIVVKSKKLEIDDVICFKDNFGDFVVHRIVDISGEIITTKGDNNEICDEPISKDSVLGKVLFVK